MTQFYKKIAAPASGKSYGAVRYIVNEILDNQKQFVVAAISTKLCDNLTKDIHQAYKEITGKDSPLDVVTIHHETVTRPRRVVDVYKEFLEDCSVDVIVTTHNSILSNNGSIPGKGWECIVDELPSIYDLKYVETTLQDDSIERWLTPITPPAQDNPMTEMKLKTGWESDFKKYLNGWEQGDKSQYLIHPNAIEGLSLLKEGEANIFRCQREQEGQTLVGYYFSCLRSPLTLWNGFSKVTFLCAEFDKQLTGLLFRHVYDIKLQDADYIRLRRTKYDKPERINIYVLIQPPTNFTKYLSTQYYDTDRKTKSRVPLRDSHIEVYEHLVDVAEEIVGKEGFIYCINRDRVTQLKDKTNHFLTERYQVERLGINSHGLNEFMQYTTALGLFHCNPKPSQRDIFRYLDKEYSVEEGTFEKGFIATSYLDPVFQLVTRTAIRKFDELEEIHCIVPDQRAADYLTEGWFKGAKVNYDYAVTFEDGRKGERKGSFPKMFDMSNGDKTAYRKWVISLGRTPRNMKTTNEDDVKLVQQWITKRRNK